MVWHPEGFSSADQLCRSACSGHRAVLWLSPWRGPDTVMLANISLPCPDWAVHSLALEVATLKVMFRGLGLKTEGPEEKFAGEGGEPSMGSKGEDLSLWTLFWGRVGKGGGLTWAMGRKLLIAILVSLERGEGRRPRVWSGPTGQKTRLERLQRKKYCYRLPGRVT